MQRPQKSPVDAAARSEASDHDLSSDFPLVAAHLMDATWDDGSSRNVSTLLVFTEDGAWKCCLHDREERATLWASGDSLMGVIGALEGLLCSGQGQWRRDKPYGGGKARKGA